MGVMSTPAFAGANFDSNGGCLRHPDVKLTQKMFTDGGKVVYKELMRRCPKCSIKRQQQEQEKIAAAAAAAQASDSSYANKSQQSSNTSCKRGSLSSNATTPSTSLSSNSNNPLSRSASRSRSRARSKSRERDTALPKSPPPSRSVSKPRQSVWGQVPSQRDQNNSSKRGGGGEGSTAARDNNNSNSNNHMQKKVFDSPFDPKGRCHYHPNISLAKKKLTGGWKVLLEACPKCVEDRYIQESHNSSDNRSVGSGSRRSTKSDNRSVSSRHSNRSDNSRRSNKSDYRSSSANNPVRSPSAPRSTTAGRLVGTPMSGKKKVTSAEKTNSARYECPFDNQGCCRIHHHVRLAKKKLTGGWKVIQDVCPECDEEDNGSVDSRNSRFSRRSVASRGGQKPESNDYNKSSSSGKGKSAAGSGNKGSKRSPEGGTRSGVDHSASSQSEHFRTKLDKVHTTTEENGEDGNRSRTSREKVTKKDKLDNKGKSSSKSSYKNETSSSNATTANRGNSKNNDVTDREVNDATTPKYQRQRSQRALKEYKDLYESAKVVKNMVFVDVHGDSGRYTGDVNEFRMPHGMGNIIYEHGLVQGGKWTNGVLDEGSISSGAKSLSESKTSLSNRVGVRSIDP